MFGEVTIPPPIPATRSGPAMAQVAASPVVCRNTSAVAVSPTIVMLSPVTVSRRPNRDTSRPAMTADTATPRANGVTLRPERSGEYPSPSWKNRASTNQIPVNPMK